MLSHLEPLGLVERRGLAKDCVGHAYLSDVVQERAELERDQLLHADAEFTSQLANAVGEGYLEQNLEKRISGTRDAGTWLAVQHTDLKKKLEAM